LPEELLREVDLTNGLSRHLKNSHPKRFPLDSFQTPWPGAGACVISRSAQGVFGIAGEHSLFLGHRMITLAGELDRVPNETEGPGADTTKVFSDLGGHFQAESRGNSPLAYGFRIEVYGENFRSNQPTATADHLSGESWVGLRLPEGGELQGRFRHSRQGREGGNPTVENFVGFDLEGLMFQNARGDLKLHLSDIQSQDRSENEQRFAGSLGFGFSVLSDLTLATDLSGEYLNDRSSDARDQWTCQGLLEANQEFRLDALCGDMFTGFRVTRMEGTLNKSLDLNPLLGFHLFWGPHQLDSCVAFEKHHQACPDGDDTASFSLQVDYRFVQGRNTFALTLDSQHMVPAPGSDTDDLRLGVSWTWAWDSPVDEHAASSIVGRIDLPSEHPPFVLGPG